MLKKIFYRVSLVLLLSVVSTLFNHLHADPPPPPGGGGIGGGNNQSGGGAAPLDGGLILLIGLAGVYGTRKAMGSGRKSDGRA